MKLESIESVPFKIATTSFIYPDDIIPNVEKLAPFFDEIEILILESVPEGVLPSKETINRLSHISEEFDTTYNIHLPTDIFLGDPSKTKRDKAVDTVVKTVELCAALQPTTNTLHIELDRKKPVMKAISISEVKRWQERVDKSLEKLVQSLPAPETISVENLDYPMRYMDPLITRWNLSVCLDAGHLIMYGFNSITELFRKYSDKVALIHLHGVDFSRCPPKDHTSLDKTPAEKMDETGAVLKNYDGVVSLEVFNTEDLISSLAYLDTLFA